MVVAVAVVAVGDCLVAMALSPLVSMILSELDYLHDTARTVADLIPDQSRPTMRASSLTTRYRRMP